MPLAEDELPSPRVDIWANDGEPCISLVIVNAPIIEYGNKSELTPGISLSPAGAINVAVALLSSAAVILARMADKQTG